MERTLNYVDTRLIDHGKRVAYLMFKVLERQNRFDNAQLRDICVLGMLHDVGAYKTEEIDKMVIFEAVDNYDGIVAALSRKSQPVRDIYKVMHEDFFRIKDRVEKKISSERF